MKLTQQQIVNFKKRLNILMPQFKRAVLDKNLTFAINLIQDINPLLKKLGKIAQLVEAQNALYEIAIEKGQISYAIEGLIANRSFVNTRTRLYLEATALLAIAYLRNNDVKNAKPYITIVLTTNHIIKSDATRKKFNAEIVRRFDEEAALFTLREGKRFSHDIAEIHARAAELNENAYESELFKQIGSNVPRSTKEVLFQIDDFSKKQLPYKERKLLVSSESLMNDEDTGRTVFSSFKRVIYDSLCDPNSEVYKAWYTNAVGSVLDKKFITAAVVTALSGYGIGSIALLISASAILLRFGLDVYCERYKPLGVTDLRRRK